MKRVMMGVGAPGAGKTTFLKPFAETNGLSYICPDDIRAELTGDAGNRTHDQEAWDQVRARVREALNAGKSVVVDATFTNQRSRREFIRFARSIGAEEIAALSFDVPLEVAHERNAARERQVPAEVLNGRHHALAQDPPSIEDGFDRIIPIAGTDPLANP